MVLTNPTPELASMNTSSPISCWKKELQLLSVELHEHSYHLSRIAAALERVAEGLDLKKEIVREQDCFTIADKARTTAGLSLRLRLWSWLTSRNIAITSCKIRDELKSILWDYNHLPTKTDDPHFYSVVDSHPARVCDGRTPHPNRGRTPLAAKRQSPTSPTTPIIESSSTPPRAENAAASRDYMTKIALRKIKADPTLPCAHRQLLIVPVITASLPLRRVLRRPKPDRSIPPNRFRYVTIAAPRCIPFGTIQIRHPTGWRTYIVQIARPAPMTGVFGIFLPPTKPPENSTADSSCEDMPPNHLLPASNSLRLGEQSSPILLFNMFKHRTSTSSLI